ncbi:hypothetical protein LUZ61_000797 [Rhynchospora tenuis]|uniref:NB-ARC domain-containing protein n=1 Tax=Rhynchospora tenuis TaxID=198213 RepID=A0AAD6EQ67_9POAL|nr:hypothetical protein LUZ61_000797 [Rhynchospora tenuis]
MDCLGILSQAVTSAVSPVVSFCISPVSVCITYPFKVSENIRDLDAATSKLVAAQADVQDKVENAQLQGLTQKNQVKEWLDRVEATKGEVDEIKKRYRERSRCFGTQSFNCWSNCRISKDATKKLTEVHKLCEDGRFEEVATQLPPQAQELPVRSEVVPKEEADLQKIREYIDNDQDNIFGIWGMGGVGKTRLLHLVHNHYKGSSAFDIVVKVTASKECSVEKIQTELCEKCGFGRGNSVESQARIISDYLSNHNFLLLLDDLWDQIDLHRVGIPFSLDLVNQFKRKVVITTRLELVCSLMGVKKPLKVVGLDHEHALRLFKEHVGDEIINSHPLIPSLALEVVKELDGLPLALKAIGASMYGKKDPREWDYTIDLLKKSRLNEIEATPEEEKIYYRLKLSYDSLENKELKDCFLACSLWPEDYHIYKTDLIECWMGLGILDASDARNIYNPGITFIRKLLSACLLEEIEPNYVKMHDVIRDMALWLAHDLGKEKDKWVVRTGAGVNQVLHESYHWHSVERATLIWIPQNLANQSIPCDANKLQFLNVSRTVRAETVVKNINFFCHLTVLNMYSCKLNSFPHDISYLVNLRHLDLSHNNISSVPEELKFVRKLKYLFLEDNWIASFPKGVISELKELLILNLRAIDNQLRKQIDNTNGEDIDGENIDGENKRDYMTWLIKEIGCLRNIRSLSITLYDATHFQSIMEIPNLPIRFLVLDYVNETDMLLIPGSFLGNDRIRDNLEGLYLSVKSASRVIIESDSQNSYCPITDLQFENMEMLEEIILQKLAPKDLFTRLETLEIYDCGKLKDISWTLYLPSLQKLELVRCDNIIQLIEHFDSTSATEERTKVVPPTFPSLNELNLVDLPNLQTICDQSIMFPSLEKIGIYACVMLKKLPFRSNTVPSKLTIINVKGKEWWERVEWEDNDLKQILQPLVQFW